MPPQKKDIQLHRESLGIAIRGLGLKCVRAHSANSLFILFGGYLAQAVTSNLFLTAATNIHIVLPISHAGKMAKMLKCDLCVKIATAILSKRFEQLCGWPEKLTINKFMPPISTPTFPSSVTL